MDSGPIENNGVQPLTRRFIPSRGRDALLALLGAAAYGGVVIFHSTLITALAQPIVPLLGIIFGPWVGGIAGALSGLLMYGIYTTRWYNPISELLSYVLFNFIAGVVPGLLVKDAKNWKNVLYASLLVSVPFFLQYIVLMATGVGQIYFWEGLVHDMLFYVVPVVLLTPLLAWALVGVVRRLGWYWRDAPRSIERLDWSTIFSLAAAWGVLWLLVFGLGKSVQNFTGPLTFYGAACGLLTGLAAVLLLRRAFPALRWSQFLLILAGWTVGILLAADAFANNVVNGSIRTGDELGFILQGAAGGIGLGAALKWGGVFTRWRQALLSAAVWVAGMALIPPASRFVSASYATRLLAAGMLTGAVGAWGIFWQRRGKPNGLFPG